METPNEKIEHDLLRIGELSLNIIEKAKTATLGETQGKETFDKAVEINKLARKIYKTLNL